MWSTPCFLKVEAIWIPMMFFSLSASFHIEATGSLPLVSGSFKEWAQTFSYLMQRADLLENEMLRWDWRQEEKGQQRMRWLDGWHHWLNGHESEQTPGAADGQGSLVCRRAWGAKSWTRLSDWTTVTRVLLFSYPTPFHVEATSSLPLASGSFKEWAQAFNQRSAQKAISPHNPSWQEPNSQDPPPPHNQPLPGMWEAASLAHWLLWAFWSLRINYSR